MVSPLMQKEVTLLASIRQQIIDPPKTQLRLVAREWFDAYIAYVEVILIYSLGGRTDAGTRV